MKRTDKVIDGVTENQDVLWRYSSGRLLGDHDAEEHGMRPWWVGRQLPTNASQAVRHRTQSTGIILNSEGEVRTNMTRRERGCIKISLGKNFPT